MTDYQRKNDELLHSILEDGETVKWKGQSEKYQILTDESKKGLYIRWAICIAAIILWAIYCIVFRNIDGASGFALAISMILIILFFGYMAFIPMLDRKKIIEKNSYYITDRRAIFLDGTDHQYIMNLYGIKAEFLPAEEGNTTLLLRNDASQKMPKSLRTIAWKPLRDEYAGGLISDMVFYNIKGEQTLRNLFD